jgi:molybdopterin converting factor small subunit
MADTELLVRYFAGARAAAGVDEERIGVPAGATVASLAGVLADRHGPGLERVLTVCTFLVDEVAGGRERPLEGARQVDVLPPFAGG